MTNFPDQSSLEALAGRVGAALLAERLTLAAAESCTGGWVSQCLTAIAGSSAWFERGFVTYSNAAKQEALGVPEATLVAHGAVSQPVAVAMAEGALRHSRADWAVAITGIAGPDGGSAEKPVGTVCFAWAGRGAGTSAETRHFAGDRQAVRAQSVARALGGLLERLLPPTGGWLA
ncbi:MAG: nicotinamide-nucleotide amidase [Candidatus Accumulibacter sp.]|jgi:nicotinamide-nucleotide amidase|nr:nicotinamide-nucleotide amidase [Accumulibacter sp.]